MMRHAFPVFVAALIAGLALRFWHLGATGWQYDEVVYHQVAAGVLQHGILAEKATYGVATQPFLYEPPWYPMMLAAWFGVAEPTVTAARVLGVVFSAGSLVAIWLLLRRLTGSGPAATIAAIPLVFDGWLLYIQRFSYIENLTLFLIAAGLLAYQRAVDTDRGWVLAGVIAGVAVAVKYTAVPILLTVLLCWLILRRAHRQHLRLLGTAALIIVLDQIVLIFLWGHFYLSDTLTQIMRVLGIRSSGGTVTSPGELVHLLFRQYDVFIPSLLIALSGLAIAVGLLWRCYRERDWAPAGRQALLFSWSAAGVVTFGLSSLRFPQYFALILVPLYLLFWTTLSERLTPALRYAALGAACAAGISSWMLSTNGQQINPFQRTEQYAAGHLAPNAVVVADEQIGDLIRQPYCREQQATAPCLRKASYVITWDTFLQQTQKLGNRAFAARFRGANAVWSVTGFSGTATVWKLAVPKPKPKPPAPVVGVDVEADQNYPLAQAQAYGKRLLPFIQDTLHASGLGIVLDLCNPSFQDGPVTRCAQSLSPQDVRALAEQAAMRHLTVQVRPLVRVGPPSGWNEPARSWEGHIRPYSAANWLASLSVAERPYLAALGGIPHAQFVLGTELQGVDNAPEWPALARQATAICGCQVSVDIWRKHYLTHVTPALSVLGTDWYPVLRLPPSASQAQVTAAWEQSLSGISPGVLSATSLDETSIRATAGAYLHPFAWDINGPAAPQVQSRYFIAACQAVAKYHMKGIWFYNIPLSDNPAAPFQFPAYFVGNDGASAIASCARIIEKQS
jgi:4-amino-4-deoxy-L-arabinose transferase-like glycosyltransferase